MKQIISSIVLASMLAGCAHYSTHQTDTSYATNGQPSRSISTIVHVTTFFDSKSEITKSRVTQTDKSQTSAVGSVSQEASGTNAIGLVQAVSAGAVEGAMKFMVPK